MDAAFTDTQGLAIETRGKMMSEEGEGGGR
jgi:hypothetical protein